VGGDAERPGTEAQLVSLVQADAEFLSRALGAVALRDKRLELRKLLFSLLFPGGKPHEERTEAVGPVEPADHGADRLPADTEPHSHLRKSQAGVLEHGIAQALAEGFG
jgi:hypothetical protein